MNPSEQFFSSGLADIVWKEGTYNILLGYENSARDGNRFAVSVNTGFLKPAKMGCLLLAHELIWCILIGLVFRIFVLVKRLLITRRSLKGDITIPLLDTSVMRRGIFQISTLIL